MWSFMRNFLRWMPVVRSTTGKRFWRNRSLRNSYEQKFVLARGLYGIQIPLGAWHTVEVKEPSVIFEAKDGAYKG